MMSGGLCVLTNMFVDTTMKDVAAALSQEDAAEAARGAQQSPDHVSPSAFIRLGLELEEQQ